MQNRHLHPTEIVLTIGLGLLFIVVHVLLIPEDFTLGKGLLNLLVIVVAALGFWAWSSRRVRQREMQIRQHVEHLEALHSAALTLTSELELGTVLQKVVDLSRKLVQARYGALGVLADDGRFLEQFITSGFSRHQRAAIGRPPQGHGLLGTSIREGRPLRIADVLRDHRSVGYPAHHPTMKSLLTVPVVWQSKIIGNLFLTDKIDLNEKGEESIIPFSNEDEEILSMFAVQAAIAIENARLYRQIEQLAHLREREQMGRDLHDGTIQSIYAIGLMLEDSLHSLENDPQVAQRQISMVIGNLNDVILGIRDYIVELRSPELRSRNLHQELGELVQDARVNASLSIKLEMDPIETDSISPQTVAEILHVAQEALSNVVKHALASQVQVHLRQEADHIVLRVADNGIGFDPGLAVPAPGRGLRNMRQRAKELQGDLAIESVEEGGTCIRLAIPYTDSPPINTAST